MSHTHYCPTHHKEYDCDCDCTDVAKRICETCQYETEEKYDVRHGYEIGGDDGF